MAGLEHEMGAGGGRGRLRASDADRERVIGTLKAAYVYGLVTKDEFGDPSGHRITLRVNGETRQDSNTSDLLFNVPAIVESVCASLTLHPGDVIATGTPSGVALGMTPQKFLNTGDVMEAEVEGIGVLRNRIVE